MLHLLGFSASVATGSNPGEVTAISDDIFNIESNRFKAPMGLNFRGVYFGSADLSRVRYQAPSVNNVGGCVVRPINRSAAVPTLPGFDDGKFLGPGIRDGEMFYFDAVHGNAGAQTVYGVALVTDGIRPSPVGRRIRVYGTSTTAAVAGAWRTISMSWTSVLDPGMWAVVGGGCISASSIAFRLMNASTAFRPGWLCLNTPGLIENTLFNDGNLGELMRFSDNNWPQVQVLSTTTTAAHEVYLDLVQIGA